MKILVGTTELTVTNCYAYRYPNGKLVLKIETPQENISHDDLKTLLKNNTEDIILTRDDGKTETFTGFHYQVKIADEVNAEGVEIHSCEVECQSENDFQIGILQRTVEEQKASQAALQQQNDGLTECILELSQSVYA